MVTGLLILFSITSALAVGGYVLLTTREMRRPPRRTRGWALATGHAADPAALGLPFDDVEFDVGNGVHIPAWIIPATADDDNATQVIVLHGWGHSRIHSLQRMSSLLCEECSFATILLDLQGHGDAPDGPSSLGAHDVSHVCAIVDQLAPNPVVLIGHSLGATVAIHVAAARPDRIKKVIAIAPYESLRSPIAATLAMRSLPAGRFADAIAWCAGTLDGRLPPTTTAASNTTQPIHVILGEQDPISPPPESQAIAKAAPKGAVTSIPNATHNDHHDHNPTALKTALRNGA